MSLKVSTSAVLAFALTAGPDMVQYVVAPTDGYIGRIRGARNAATTGTNTVAIAVGANAGNALSQSIAAAALGTVIGTQKEGLVANGTSANRRVEKGQIIKITSTIAGSGVVAAYLEIDPVDYTTSLPKRSIDNSNV